MNWYMHEVFTIYTLLAFIVALASKGVIPIMLTWWLVFGLFLVRILLFAVMLVMFFNSHDRNN
jgi:hypothetical protein